MNRGEFLYKCGLGCLALSTGTLFLTSCSVTMLHVSIVNNEIRLSKNDFRVEEEDNLEFKGLDSATPEGDMDLSPAGVTRAVAPAGVTWRAPSSFASKIILYWFVRNWAPDFRRPRRIGVR